MKRNRPKISILVTVGVAIALQGLLGNIVAEQLKQWLGPWVDYVPFIYVLITIGLIGFTVRNQLTQPGAKLAKYLLSFLPKKEREPLLGDLEEEYHEIFKKFGKRQAEIWCWCQVATSLPPLLIATIKKIVMRSIRRWIV